MHPLKDLHIFAKKINYYYFTFLFLSSSAFLFCIPFLLCLILDAGFLSLANEPLAYRYFYSERIFFGETISVGVGYLVSTLHHIVYSIILLFPSLYNSSIENKLDFFALLTNGIISLFLCCIFFISFKLKKSNLTENTILVLSALLPIYATVGTGFNYSLAADYNFLNIVLCVFTLFLFQILWRNKESISENYVFLLGFFVGIATSNKITMLVITAVVLIPAIFSKHFNLYIIAKRLIISISGFFTAFLFIHFASYLFNYSRMRVGLRTWWSWAKNPGGEPLFWDNLPNLLIESNYIYFIIFSFLVLLISFLVFLTENKRKLINFILSFYCFIAFLSCIFFILKRPAGSTLFESTIFIFTLSLILVSTICDYLITKYIVLLLFITSTFLAILTFPFYSIYSSIALSRSDSHNKWSVFYSVQKLAAGRPIEVIFPDNTYHHEGPYELLLKGASVFPSSWKIESGQRIIDIYSPNTTFRNNNSETTPKMPYGNQRILVWFDIDNNLKLEDQYHELQVVLSRQGVVRLNPAKYNQVNVHVAVIP